MFTAPITLIFVVWIELFCRWCNASQRGRPAASADRSSRPSRAWHRLPTEIRNQNITRALEEPELSPCELAVRFTFKRRYFVSEATVNRRLKT